jgi:hypothetical protein
MRTYVWLAGLALGLAGVGSAQAQNLTITPNIAPNQPMDYRNVNAPIGANLFKPNANGSAFSLKLSQMFYSPSRLNSFSNTQVRGTSIFPTPAQMQASAPGYLRAFQMYRGSCIQP